ncbi:MAG: SpoIIE family protein phosphatase [Planctomycetes bacterium]|nr:SpoIIE family protein phosphatase [Planctomycetota bacterium]
MATLMVIQGASEYVTLELYKRNTVGRDSRNTLAIPDPTLAPTQFELLYRGERFLVKSVNTGQAMYVNGEEVDHRFLENGDVIQAGNVQFLFCQEDNEEPADAPDIEGDTSQFDPDSSVHPPVSGEMEQIQARTLVAASGDVLRNIEAGPGDQARRRLAILFEVTSAIAQLMKPDDLFDKLLELIFEVFPAETGSIWRLEEGRVRVKAARNRRGRIQGGRVRVSRTILREAMHTREAILTRDAMADDRFLSGQSIVDLDMHSAMCVPLVFKDDILGVVQIETSNQDDVFTQDDLNLLSAIGNQAAVALKNAQLFEDVREKERIEYELSLASRIQESLLPQSPPEVDGIELTGRLIPAKEIGGDYYDFLPAPDGSGLYIAIGDVTGKGLPAGLVMVMARSLLLPLVDQGLSTRDIIVRANRHLYANTDKKTFMTMNLLRWDSAKRRLVYTGAGHEHLILCPAGDAKPRVFRAGGMALGISDRNDETFQERQIPVNPGDTLVLYTDGVTEAIDRLREQFTLDRLVRTVHRLKKEPLDRMVEGTLARVREFTGDVEQFDDITLVVARRTA